MANRTFFDVQSLQRETKIITGVVGDGVTSLPTGIETAAAAGSDLTLTLDDKYNDLVGAHLTAKSLTGTFSHVEAVAFNTSNTVVFTVDNLNAADEFYVTLFLKNTSVER